MTLFDKKNLEKYQDGKQERKQHTILLVDDEKDNLQMLASALGDDYHVLRAENGLEALDLIRKMTHPEDISLILSDQRMPGLTGIALFEKVREIIPRTIRIIVTGFTDVEVIIDSINQAGIYKLITKPFDIRSLLLTVQRAVEAFELQRKMDEYLKTLEERVKQRTIELERKNKELEEISLTDPLTGLNNRRFLIKYLDTDIAKSRRDYRNWFEGAGMNPPAESDLIFFMLDIDHFKSVNDTHGHGAGDRVLMQMRELMAQSFREMDFLVRWGGEEFLLVARFLDRKHAEKMAERLRQSIAENLFDIGEGQVIRKTCSIGFAAYPFLPRLPESVSWSQVIDIADSALYLAKRNGRNAWVGFSATGRTKTDDLLQRVLQQPEQLVQDGELEIASSVPVDFSPA